MVDLHAALARDSEVVDLRPLAGLAGAWTWTGPNDRFRMAAVPAADGAHSFEICTLDSWNEELARAVLAFALQHSAALVQPERLFTPVAAFQPPAPGFTFDTVASVGSGVSSYPHDDVPELTEATVPVFPAWSFEFSELLTRAEAEYLVTRASGLRKTYLDREPLPFHRMRFINSKMRNRTLGNGRKLTDRGVLAHNLTELAGTDASSFVEFENRFGAVWTVTWRDDGWHVAGDDRRERIFDLDGMLDFARDALRSLSPG